MKTLFSALVAALVTAAWCGSAFAWAHAGFHGFASGGGGSWSAHSCGSASGGDGSWNAHGADGGDGSWQAHGA